MSIEYIPDDETRLDTKDVWIEELQERIKQLEEAKKRALVIIIEGVSIVDSLEEINTKLAEQLKASMADFTNANKKSKQPEEYIEKLENEIKGYLGQHDSTDQ